MNASRKRWWLAGGAVSLLAFVACSNAPKVEDTSGLVGGAGGVGGSAATGGMSAAPGVAADGGTGGDMMGGGTAGSGGAGAVGGSSIVDVDAGVVDPMEDCPDTTCAALGVGCGKIVDKCGNVIDCAAEGLTCGPLEVCTGGADMPASCQVGGEPCDLCHAVEDCSAAAQPTTLVGRVITPGRDDTDHGNQVGVPNAFVYITRNAGIGDLPAITAGIPEGGTSCDRCEDQVAALGPVLVGTITDATGAFTLAGNVPVGEEFTLVVKAGRFRRAIAYTVPAAGACAVNMLSVTTPDNPTRLPRDMKDGLAVNMPRIAVATGQVDAMECVLEKMGISHDEFKNPDDAAARVHLYVGGRAPNGDGARLDTATPFADALYGDAETLNSYDIVLSDCEGQNYDRSRADRNRDGGNVMQYVNRGGRLFASHLNYTWLDENGTTPYSADAPEMTGLGPAATWDTMDDGETDTGIGAISMTSAQASPRIQSFADWMSNEAVATAPDYVFDIVEPRSQNLTLGASSEEFVATTDGKMRVQQFSFNTPYAAPAEGVCGRVAYSGFHVSVGNTSMKIFPEHCTGDLTKQEKVLLYMLFDLSACVGETPPPPPCEPDTCESLELKCGFSGDGCGDVLDCGPCPLPIPK